MDPTTYQIELQLGIRVQDWMVCCSCKTWLIGFCWAGVTRIVLWRDSSPQYIHYRYISGIRTITYFRSPHSFTNSCALSWCPHSALPGFICCDGQDFRYFNLINKSQKVLHTFSLTICIDPAHKPNINQPLQPMMSTDMCTLQPGQFIQVSRFTESL